MFYFFPVQVYQDAPGVEHIPVVQIDLSVPLKVPGEARLQNVTFMTFTQCCNCSVLAN